ncbi:hypothetical protein LZ30DRAFT_424904 [Colletotrichum cereale]|nr:hypothetical protein LZ30DRAFT_424904 [Colletotrichum cereale]
MLFPCLIQMGDGIGVIAWHGCTTHYMHVGTGWMCAAPLQQEPSPPSHSSASSRENGKPPRFDYNLPPVQSREGYFVLGNQPRSQPRFSSTVAEAVTPATLDRAAPPTPRDCILS